jgi:hypothetical protein
MGGAMKIEVKNWDNQVTGKIELPDAVFARKVNQHLVWEVVRAYLASRRRGTHKTRQGHPLEAVEAEAHRPRTRRLPPVAAVAHGWRCARSATAVLRAEGQQEGAPRRIERSPVTASGGGSAAGA